MVHGGTLEDDRRQARVYMRLVKAAIYARCSTDENRQDVTLLRRMYQKLSFNGQHATRLN